MSYPNTGTNNSDEIRCFIAVEIDNTEALNRIVEYQTNLQKSLGPLKLVNKKQMHITLRFLGNITYTDAESIYRFIQDKIQPFLDRSELNKIGTLQGVGDFNRRTFIIKIKDVVDILEAVHSKLELELESYPRIKPENRPYTPHLTIARSKKNRERNKSKSRESGNPGQISYSKLKHEYSSHDFGQFRITEIVLKKSILTPRGPIYSNLKFTEAKEA